MVGAAVREEGPGAPAVLSLRTTNPGIGVLLGKGDRTQGPQRVSPSYERAKSKHVERLLPLR